MKYDYHEFTQAYVALGDGSAVKRKGANLNMLFLFALKSAFGDEIAVATYESYKIERLKRLAPKGIAIEIVQLMPDCKVFGRDITSAAFFDSAEEAVVFVTTAQEISSRPSKEDQAQIK